MRHTRHALIPLLLILPLTTTAQIAPPGAEPAPPTVSAAGTGRVEAAPDVAEIHLAVVTEAPTAQRAGAANARRVRDVRDALQQAGVPAAALVTRGYRVQPRWRHHDGERTTDGYEAHHTLVVQDRQPDAVGPLIDTALEAGANRVETVRFTLSDRETLRHRALREAVAQARAEAAVMACAAGGRLGTLEHLSADPGGGEPPLFALRAQEASDATATVPEAVTVEARVQGQWGFDATPDGSGTEDCAP